MQEPLTLDDSLMRAGYMIELNTNPIGFASRRLPLPEGQPEGIVQLQVPPGRCGQGGGRDQADDLAVGDRDPVARRFALHEFEDTAHRGLLVVGLASYTCNRAALVVFRSRIIPLGKNDESELKRVS